MQALQPQTQSRPLSKVEQARLAAELLRVRSDLFYFLEEYCWTLDEDAAPGENPIKRFPKRSDRPELYDLAQLWLNKEELPEQRKLGVDKSRQMMGTWIFLLCNLWLAAFHDGKRVVFQSKKEEDAVALLDRAWFTFQRLPKWLKPSHQKKEAVLIFEKKNSRITAIPQGGDHIRSHTVSSCFSDEAAKQPEFGEAVAASIPSVGKWGRFTFLSTPRGKGNHFYHLMKKSKILDMVAGCETLSPRTTARLMTIVSLHYGLNPKYDQAWIDVTRAQMGEEKWNQEYEISYETPTGTPVLSVDPLIHFRKLEHLSGKPLRRGWDFGYRNPAVSVSQMNQKDQWMWLWGMVGEDETTRTFAKRAFEICDAKFPQAKDEQGRPLKQLWSDYCDPQGTEVSRGSGTSDIQDLCAVHEEHYRKMMDINYRKRDFEIGITLIRERLKLRNDGEPGILIHDEFVDAMDAVLGGYHFPEDRKSGAKNEYPAEDGYFIHLMDTIRYKANCLFEPAESRVKVQQEAWPEPWKQNAGSPGLMLVR